MKLNYFLIPPHWLHVHFGVRVVVADADLPSLGSGQDCVLPSRDSSFPERPGLPYGEPACVWWKIQRFPPAETKPRAPVWERNKTLFTSTSTVEHIDHFCVWLMRQFSSEPVQRRDAVDGFQAAARRHHVEAIAAVTWHMEVMSGVSVLHHDDEPGPAVGQVVACHPLSALRKYSQEDPESTNTIQSKFSTALHSKPYFEPSEVLVAREKTY